MGQVQSYEGSAAAKIAAREASMASSEAECASSLGVEAGAQQTRSLSPILRLSQERTRSSEADEQQTRSLSPNPHPSHKRTRSPSPACDSGLKSDDTERLIARASRWGFQFPTKRVKVDASQDILLQADSPMVAQWPLGPVAKLEYGDTILPPDITPFDQQPQLDSQLAKQEVGKSTPPLGIAPLVEQEISADTPPPAIGPTEMQPLQTGAYLVGQRFSDSAPPPVVALKQRQPAPKDSKLAKQETSADLSHPKTAPERAESPNIRFSLVKSRTIDGAGPSTSMNVRDSFELPPLWSELNAVNDSQHQPPAPVMRPEKQPVPKSYPPRNTPRSPAPSGKMTEQIRVWSQIFRNGPLTEKLSSALPPHPPAGQVPLLETLSRGWSVIAHGAYGSVECLTIRLATLCAYYSAWTSPGGFFQGSPCAQPAVVYIASTKGKCKAFACELQKLDNIPSVATVGHVEELKDNAAPAIGASVLCCTPLGLLTCMNMGRVGLACASLVIFDEANLIVTERICDHVTQIQDLLRKQKDGAATTQLLIASGFSAAQMAKLTTNSDRLFCGNAHVLDMNTGRHTMVTPALRPNGANSSIAPSGLGPQKFVTPTLTAPKTTPSQTIGTPSDPAPHAPKSLSLSFAVANDDEQDVIAIKVFLQFWPEVRLHALNQGDKREMGPGAIGALTTGTRNVFLGRLGIGNSNITAPCLHGSSVAINACIFRVYKESPGRSWYTKYQNLVAQIGRISQVKDCFTILGGEEYKVGHANKISRWLEAMERSVPLCLHPKSCSCEACAAGVPGTLAN